MKLLTTAGLIILWAIFVSLFFVIDAKTSRPDVVRGDLKSLDQYLTTRFEEAFENKTLGCGGYAIIRGSKIMTERGFGIANRKSKAPVNVDSTLFLLSSLSKAVTAWGVLNLVAQQKINLDDPVSPHLSRWKFSSNDTLARHVTVRHLLSHTAGIIDGYGHSGVESKENLQSIEQSLSSPNDVNSGAAHGITITLTPGSTISYSSAGYGVTQLLIEEKTNMPFHEYMSKEILLPLGMHQSSFRLEDIEVEKRSKYLASQYDLELTPHPHRYYSNHAGVSLRSSIHDLASLATAYSKPNGVLTADLIREFHTPQPGTADTWGLGHTLYIKNPQGEYIFGHGGGAFPASGADMRINPSSGNAIVLVATGSQNFISPLADDWMYWETGERKFDIRDLIRKRATATAVLVLLGSVAIIVLRTRRPGAFQK